ncbi:MAG: hypothetical protein JWN85_3232 [Gammaproteobacteria bacterium]|nr:hypothetical protein [Gammaproteobacteria bacterium]
MEDKTMEFGLLLEAARAQQTLAHTVLEKLKAHMCALDEVVREEIRRTLIDELQVLGNDSRRASEALRGLGRSVNLRVALWSVGITALCAAIPLVAAWWLLPSRGEVAALRSKRDELAASVAALEQRGARIDLRRCGGTDRLCVRVDRKAPVYGEAADYFVVKGY